MSFPRLLATASLLSVLAACNNSSAPAPQAGTAPATTTPTAAAPAAPAATTTVAAATPAPAAPAADDKLAPLVGVWSADLATCGTTPIRITATSFEGAENQCTIKSFTDNGDGSFTAAMDCNSQGTKASERIKMRPLFAPTGEGIGLTYLDRNNTEATVLRCVGAK